MASWKDEYLVSILNAEKNNPVNAEIAEACMPTSSPHSPSFPLLDVHKLRPFN